LWYGFLQFLARILFVLFFHIRVFGRSQVPAEGGVLIASTHQSFFDPILIGVGLHRQVHSMAREDLFRGRLFRRLITSLNAFPVRRASADLGAVRESVRRLQAGKLVVVFPEGTRTADGSIGEPFAGIETIARRGGARVVPAVIEGAYRAWPRHKKLFGFAPIQVIFGAPLTPDPRGAIDLRGRWLELKGRLGAPGGGRR